MLSGTAAVHAAAGDRELRELPLDLIRRNRFQPRRLMDPQALEELAQSIRARGSCSRWWCVRAETDTRSS